MSLVAPQLSSHTFGMSGGEGGSGEGGGEGGCGPGMRGGGLGGGSGGMIRPAHPLSGPQPQQSRRSHVSCVHAYPHCSSHQSAGLEGAGEGTIGGVAGAGDDGIGDGGAGGGAGGGGDGGALHSNSLHVPLLEVEKMNERHHSLNCFVHI